MRTPTPPDARDRVLRYLRDHPEGRSVIQVVVGTGLTESTTRRMLPALRADGLIEQEKGNRGHGIPDTWRATREGEDDLGATRIEADGSAG